MQTINFDIGQLLRKVRSGHFLIPQFQRDFTWQEGQTRLLIDSIARNYPVGSLLILGENDKVSLKSRKLDANYPPEDENLDETYDEPGSESYYVLDGQQRLTSIARVFLDAHPRQNYYFDLKKMHEVFSEENTAWIVSRRRGKKNPERKENNRLIRSDVALNQQKCDVFISEYMEDSGDFPEFESDKTAARQAAARLKGVFETIRKFSIPFVALDNNAPLESVCRVFETINSTGTRLTTFDLAVARYYPSPDLKGLLDASKEAHPMLNDYEIDGERVLQILSLFYLRKNRTSKVPQATRSVLLSLERQYIEEQWEDAAFHLHAACEWINGLGATAETQPPHGTLVSIAATLMCFPGALLQPKFSNMLNKWYFCTTLAANPSPAHNYKIGDDFRRFCGFLEGQSSIQFPRVHFETAEIIDISHTTGGRYKAIQVLMRNTIRKDFMTGSALQGDLEDHHIFPYALNKSGLPKRQLNSIANRIIVSKSTNRDLADRNPDAYMPELASLHVDQGSHQDLDRRLQTCFIPYSCSEPEFEKRFRKEAFRTFLEDRAEKIVERIREVVGDAWKEPRDSEDANLEDGEFVAT
ncbi:MAG: DUF262 domain-containing protein [Gammaproteobacteria bacterium]|nr:DUF262 domain-containing protein [Gammaproteobacteria bacterium]